MVTAKAKRIPGPATSWESNEDATEWTFYLRKGAKFHDGYADNPAYPHVVFLQAVAGVGKSGVRC